MPLVKEAEGKRKWVGAVASYTLAGAVSSALVGAGLGLLGQVFLSRPAGIIGTSLALAVAIATTSRELGWIRLPLPQLRRQTNGYWGKLHADYLAAALWGFDLGLIFTTWSTFSGVWVLAVLGLVSRSPALGAALFVAYWLGRALSVWLAPLMLARGRSTPTLLEALAGLLRLVRQIHVAGIVLSVAVLITMLFSYIPA